MKHFLRHVFNYDDKTSFKKIKKIFFFVVVEDRSFFQDVDVVVIAFPDALGDGVYHRYSAPCYACS